MISVIIPTYKSNDYLALCLRSAIYNQTEPNQIIVVMDGPDEAAEDVIAQFPTVEGVTLPVNRGESVAHNTGVTLAESDRILIVNSDNVFPPRWDADLNQVYRDDVVMAPNQIEPLPSIFPNFVIKDFGITPDTFDFDAFNSFVTELHTPRAYTHDGQTWPLFMSKKWYMILGGIDERFPYTPYADWDFFLRAELAGLKCVRTYAAHFYHFANAGHPNKQQRRIAVAEKEAVSVEYFHWKWGFYPNRSNSHNSAVPLGQHIRGVHMPLSHP